MQSVGFYKPSKILAKATSLISAQCVTNENFKDDQPHLLQCDKLVSDSIITANLPEYEDLFSNEVNKQVVIVKLLKENFEKRRHFLEEEKLN